MTRRTSPEPIIANWTFTQRETQHNRTQHEMRWDERQEVASQCKLYLSNSCNVFFYFQDSTIQHKMQDTTVLISVLTQAQPSFF